MEKEAESIYKRHRDYLEKMNAGGQTACCGSNMIISINEKINEPKLEISIAYFGTFEKRIVPQDDCESR